MEYISDKTKYLFVKCLFANELGSNEYLIYKFSDPDGERSGKSGWSFGIVQFDILNNTNAILALREMEFTTDEISGLKSQTIDIEPMNEKLLLNKSIVDAWDRKQIDECLEVAFSRVADSECTMSDDYVILHLADYHNQFGMSKGGKMHSWLRASSVPVTAEMVRDFKYTLPWGIKQLAKNNPKKDDVLRRYNNIVRVVQTLA